MNIDLDEDYGMPLPDGDNAPAPRMSRKRIRFEFIRTGAATLYLIVACGLLYGGHRVCVWMIIIAQTAYGLCLMNCISVVQLSGATSFQVGALY